MTQEQAGRIQGLLAFQSVQLHEINVAIATLMLVSVSKAESRTARFRELERDVMRSLEENRKALVGFVERLDDQDRDTAEAEELMAIVEALKRPIGFKPVSSGSASPRRARSRRD